MKAFRLTFLSAIVLGLLTISVNAQNFNNTGSWTNNGTMTFYQSGAQLTNQAGATFDNSDGTVQYESTSDDPILQNDGTFTTAATSFLIFLGPIANGHDVFTGTNELGADDANRILGLTRYGLDAGGPQHVQGVFYANLDVTGSGTKTVVDNAHVSEEYTVEGGDRTYQGTFFYDGNIAQTLAPEGESAGNINNYNNLDLSHVDTGTGEKNILDNEAVYVRGTFNTTADQGFDVVGELTIIGTSQSDAGATIYVDNTGAATGSPAITLGDAGTFDGDVTVNNGTFTHGSGDVDHNAVLDVNADGVVDHSTGAVTYDGTVDVDGGQINQNDGDVAYNSNTDVDAGGTITTGSGTTGVDNSSTMLFTDGTFTVPAASGDITINSGSTLDFVDNNGVLDIQSGTGPADGNNMFVTGTFQNGGDGTNLTFGDFSTVDYNGTAQTVVPTVNTASSNQYATLVLSGDGEKTAGGDVYVREGFNLTAVNGGNGQNFDMDANTLYITERPAAADIVSYGAEGQEVVGNMQRTTFSSLTSDASYLFNNAQTEVTFTEGYYDGYMSFDVAPQTNPNNYEANTDVNRKITVDFDNNGWTATVRAGYKSNEIGGLNPADPWFATEDNLRFFEAPGGATDAQKVATGQGINRDPNDPVRYLELEGITAATVQLPDAANTNSQFFASNDLLLRGGPTTFITITNGRWSNPGTWDEGIQPSSNDDAIVRHTVHVGFYRENLGEGADGQINEFGVAQVTDQRLANDVTIEDVADASLIFGTGPDAGEGEISPADLASPNDPYLFKEGATLTNLNTNTIGLAAFDDAALNTVTGNNTLYNGLLFLGDGVRLRVNSIDNQGNAGNGGTVEIGD
ncbi:MAG: beta strand repeat-containing protein [Candidatus Kapaibacterium sp.]